MLPLSEEAYWEMMEERTALPFGGYGNAMAQEAAWYHNQGLACPFDCARCDTGVDPEEGMEYAGPEWETVGTEEDRMRVIAMMGQAPGDPWNTDPEPPF